ncbi:MAG TPA: phosphoribosylformylglycinamidine synthase I [Thermoplasmata archaeon]|nr:phosphoribosylformylglycinamidine synthase I [Thermoplasmata archaeon]
MARERLKIAIVSIEGTNNDEELFVAMKTLGARPEIVHLKQLEGRDVARSEVRRLFDYQVLLFPGGFAAGDYVRAGAILAARVRAAIGPELESFVKDGRLVGGVCNGFQVLTELGLLPGRRGGRLGTPEAALMTNDSGRYECRPTFLAWQGGRFPPLAETPTGSRYMFPSGHAEGKLVLGGDAERKLHELEAAGQVLFRWVAPDGSWATYPWNPNGSPGNVAGLTNPEGNVFGLMPHPERGFFHWQAPDWTRTGTADGWGDGHRFFDSILRYAERHL